MKQDDIIKYGVGGGAIALILYLYLKNRSSASTDNGIFGGGGGGGGGGDEGSGDNVADLLSQYLPYKTVEEFIPMTQQMTQQEMLDSLPIELTGNFSTDMRNLQDYWNLGGTSPFNESGVPLGLAMFNETLNNTPQMSTWDKIVNGWNKLTGTYDNFFIDRRREQGTTAGMLNDMNPLSATPSQAFGTGALIDLVPGTPTGITTLLGGLFGTGVNERIVDNLTRGGNAYDDLKEDGLPSFATMKSIFQNPFSHMLNPINIPAVTGMATGSIAYLKQQTKLPTGASSPATANTPAGNVTWSSVPSSSGSSGSKLTVTAPSNTATVNKTVPQTATNKVQSAVSSAKTTVSNTVSNAKNSVSNAVSKVTSLIKK